MSKIRVKYELVPDAMEISEIILQEPLNFESSEKRTWMISETRAKLNKSNNVPI
jgi:hypothetical protein